MKNFSIILLVFFFLALLFAMLSSDPLFLFIAFSLGLLICLLCAIIYMGAFRGTVTVILALILPFLIEYLLSLTKWRYFSTAAFSPLIFKNPLNLISINNLFLAVTIPLFFICSIFFAQKIKSHIKIKEYHGTFLFLLNTLLVAVNFLLADNGATIDPYKFGKWLIIAAIANFFLYIFYRFFIDAKRIYKELPVIIYLALFWARTLKAIEPINLAIIIILTFAYLVFVIKESRYKKISQPF